MAVLLFGVFLILAIALFLVPGVGWIAVVPLVLALAAGAWVLAALAAKRRTAGDVVRAAPDVELLGPGGPDDPNAR